MFNDAFTKKLKNVTIFVIVYTIIFILFFSTISYTLPFVLAFLIALWIKPLTIFFKKKLKLNIGLSSLLSTIIIFSVLFLILTAIIFKITTEIKDILNNLPDINKIAIYAQGYVSKLELYFNQIDPSIIDRLQTQITSLLSNTYLITVTILKKSISFAIKLPVLFMIIFITLLATYFFEKDLIDMENKFLSIFSEKTKEKVITIWNEGNRMFSGYIKAYSFVIFLTFIETLIGFSILKVKYALILSVISAILDILPILGIGLVYFITAFVYFITKNYVVAAGIIALYIVVTILRQIIEPKVVSSSLGLKPIGVLAAIFIGITAYGFVGMIYFLFLMVFYKIFVKADVL